MFLKSGLDVKERLVKQRQLLNARLGLDVAAKIGLDTFALFTNEDLSMNTDKIEINEKTSTVVKVCEFLFHF